MLAATFVTSGIDVLHDPEPLVAEAEPVVPELASRLGFQANTGVLVRVNAATQVVAGALLGLGKLRRLSALALMASLVPTTYVSHRFWEADDPAERAKQRSQFLKDLAVLGGLVLELVDSEGRPSLAWPSPLVGRRAAQAATAGGALAVSPIKLAGGAATAGTGSTARTAAEATGDAADAARFAKGMAEMATRAGAAADHALKAKAVAQAAAASKDRLASTAKTKVLKDVAGRVLSGGSEVAGAARQLAARAAAAKAVNAVAGRAAR